MERSIWFYLLLGAVVVVAPAVTDRLVKGRVSEGARIGLGFLAAAAARAVLAVVVRPLGL